MDMSYTTLIWHGEQLGIKGTDVEMTNRHSMSRDVDDHYRGIHENVDEQQDKFLMNFVEDAETPLYPGPKQPSNDINIYLQLLIDDLQQLWENGVEVYDVFTRTVLNLKMLPSFWPFPSKKSWFDGHEELEERSRIMSGTQILKEHLLLRHNLDVMHIEKNVDEIVAIGRWVTNDPNAMVHCVALGKNASRVWVDEVKNPSIELWKKFADMETIEDALGSSIAWPTKAIIVRED
ncbi:hypothetical protein WN944_001210 [Citrus x changshan-huyou]|uniref:DUF8039 domain-containing protein n=1 Tax=Citrus x changshan-huyou TaxID=2935761 RepID=A0AAP0MGR7_9ROSI